jgi:hypothetical protein
VDPALQERTFKLIQTSVRNQDLIYFFRGFSMNPKATNALREFFETNYNSVGTWFLRIDVSLLFHADFSFAGPCLDIHTSRDDVYDEVHNPSGCRASNVFSSITSMLFLVSCRVCIPDSRTRETGSRQRHSSRYEFMAHCTQTRHESPTLLQDKDIGKYNQALAQALDGISAKAAFIKVRRNSRAYLCPS